MDDIWTRFVGHLVDRLTGPMQFRVILQPIMASILAVRAGLADARLGRPPYLWSLLSDPEHRVTRLADGWKSVSRVFVVAIVLDVVYQVIVLRFVYPGEALIVAILLAIMPYLFLRGLVTRFARKL